MHRSLVLEMNLEYEDSKDQDCFQLASLNF